MNMFSVWTLGSLILSYTLAFPILNDTSTESSKADFSNSTDGQGNRSHGDVPLIIARGSCLLPTCNLHTLPNKLQTGDEIAGKITQDPFGPGKK
ncbi:hypothetical protein PO909_029092 [Leuciscus waleckii]